MTTTERIEQIRERLKVATPGPWSVPHFADPAVNCECQYVLCDGHMGAVATVHYAEPGDMEDAPPRAEAIANAWLLANAPDDLAFLIASTSPAPTRLSQTRHGYPSRSRSANSAPSTSSPERT